MIDDRTMMIDAITEVSCGLDTDPAKFLLAGRIICVRIFLFNRIQIPHAGFFIVFFRPKLLELLHRCIALSPELHMFSTHQLVVVVALEQHRFKLLVFFALYLESRFGFA